MFEKIKFDNYFITFFMRWAKFPIPAGATDTTTTPTTTHENNKLPFVFALQQSNCFPFTSTTLQDVVLGMVEAVVTEFLSNEDRLARCVVNMQKEEQEEEEAKQKKHMNSNSKTTHTPPPSFISIYDLLSPALPTEACQFTQQYGGLLLALQDFFMSTEFELQYLTNTCLHSAVGEEEEDQDRTQQHQQHAQQQQQQEHRSLRQHISQRQDQVVVLCAQPVATADNDNNKSSDHHHLLLSLPLSTYKQLFLDRGTDSPPPSCVCCGGSATPVGQPCVHCERYLFGTKSALDTDPHIINTIHRLD